ncbi:MAG TPA: alpha/beta hydrolase [Actinophytocola sp.]|uniref:alpha/beta fold hydrolase n=1 Tax=Actinophytocola sp. TaxID=1872138 RepID=UPI002E009F11|nr:alpha/beta hydrolase [Actinophytocola sp.]
MLLHAFPFDGRAGPGGAGWVLDGRVRDDGGAARGAARRADVVDTVRRLMAEAPAASVAWAQRAMAGRADSAATLRDADVPALILHGEEDNLIPVAAARQLAELLPRAEIVTFPGTGHLPPLEVPAEVTAAMGDWLERIGF